MELKITGEKKQKIENFSTMIFQFCPVQRTKLSSMKPERERQRISIIAIHFS